MPLFSTHFSPSCSLIFKKKSSRLNTRNMLRRGEMNEVGWLLKMVLIFSSFSSLYVLKRLLNPMTLLLTFYSSVYLPHHPVIYFQPLAPALPPPSVSSLPFSTFIQQLKERHRHTPLYTHTHTHTPRTLRQWILAVWPAAVSGRCTQLGSAAACLFSCVFKRGIRGHRVICGCLFCWEDSNLPLVFLSPAFPLVAFLLFIFYYTALLPPSFHFPLSVILSAPRSNFGSMEPRGALSQSYLHPRLSSSSSRSSSTSSSSSSPLPLVQEESSMRILWCTRAGEFVFSSSLYFCCVVSGGKWWRGCSSTTLQPIPSITSQSMEIHTGTRLHWFLPALGFAHSILPVRTDRMFSAPEETNFFFHLLQHTSHCFRSKVLCMDQNSRWCRPESHILIFFFILRQAEEGVFQTCSQGYNTTREDFVWSVCFWSSQPNHGPEPVGALGKLKGRETTCKNPTAALTGYLCWIT